MKKGFLYYCLVISLIVHLAVVFFVRIEQAQKKEKEPVVIDLLGQPVPGPVTKLPEGAKKSMNPMVAPREKGRDIVAKAAPMRPSVPFFPMPESRPAAPPPPPAPPQAALPQGQGSDTQRFPANPAPTQKAAPQASSGSTGSPERPKRIVGPSTDDLMRYAKIDRETEKSKDDQTITLDTDDLMYTSYLQAMKKRIELIWKYPETARRDGLQGNLVMRFSINKSGRVDSIVVVKSSGYPELDEAARQALMDANPFNPLPDNWKKEYFTITGTFVYRLYGMYLR